jgi:hypothetical protein
MSLFEALLRLYLIVVVVRLTSSLAAGSGCGVGLAAGAGRSRVIEISPMRALADISLAVIVGFVTYQTAYSTTHFILWSSPLFGFRIIVGLPWSLLPAIVWFAVFVVCCVLGFRHGRSLPAVPVGKQPLRLRRTILGGSIFTRRRSVSGWMRSEMQAGIGLILSSAFGALADKLAGDEAAALIGQSSPVWLAGIPVDELLNDMDDAAGDLGGEGASADTTLAFLVLLKTGRLRLVRVGTAVYELDPFVSGRPPRRAATYMGSDGLHVGLTDGEVIIAVEEYAANPRIRFHIPQCFTGKYHCCPESWLILPVSNPAVLLARKPLRKGEKRLAWYLFKAVSNGYQFVLMPVHHTLPGEYRERATAPRDMPRPLSGSWIANISRGRIDRSTIRVSVGPYSATMRYNPVIQGWTGRENGPSGHSVETILWVTSKDELLDRFDKNTLDTLSSFPGTLVRSSA